MGAPAQARVRLDWEGKQDPGAVGVARDPVGEWVTAHGAGRLLQGDNLGVIRGLGRSDAGTVTLASPAPPFFTNREHTAWLRKAGAPRGTARLRVPAFDDRWPGLSAWLDAMGGRLHAVRTLLAPHGSIVVPVHPKTSHYVKLPGDQIFGPEAFASEIVWRYQRSPAKTPNFPGAPPVL